ncbi:glycosyltransferase [Anoxybacillus sp. FSL W8-1294]|uniref:glycosyltransferase n=1 Tax=Anoxybacillus sp. FSL W8-1294 TaxID=2954655 RepID=UPI0030D4E1B7
MSNINLLVIPSFYPTAEDPLTGNFFHEQIIEMSKKVKIGVIYPERRSIKKINIKGIILNHFQTSFGEEHGIPVYRSHRWNVIPDRFKLGALLWVRSAIKLADQYIKQNGTPDLVHAHCALWGGYAAKLIAEKYKIPYIISEHSSSYGLGKIKSWEEKYIRSAMENASLITTVSRGFSNTIQEYTNVQNIEVIPNFIDMDFFTLPPNRIEGEKFIFTSIGWLNKNKGFDLLIRAFHRAFKDQENVYLNIVGRGSERNNLLKIIKELRLENRVNLLGELNRQQIRDILWKSHCLVLASYVETFGIVLIEALATGIPVIASDTDGPSDIITKETGLIFRRGDIFSLEKKLQKLYNDYSFYNSYKIRKYAEDRYSASVVTTKIKELYEKVIGRN